MNAAANPNPAPAACMTGEEWANAITHGVGLVFSVMALALLVTCASLRGDAWHVTASAIYGTTLVLLYASSTLYHSARRVEVKRLLRTLDHSAIFLLIAGTYTPFLLVSLRGPWGWSLFGVVWTLAIAGIAVKFWFTDRFPVASTLIYVAMGWLIISALRPLVHSIAMGGFWFLLAGGLCYTGGLIFYGWKRLPYHHAVWHLFVLGGSVCHFLAVFNYVLPTAAGVSG